ncbi:MAG: bifunctional methylenetetrahydrofolate dehydrogenase/methenyltetrahydrofolate cyclohydrolase FolD [Ignavibacteriae bacterium]|nr:bifunctional methylenetetrahydrofolate dehydrogenase/methenyltetrahydrofolate cyclohydrolase FolD [Ignavibacteriota bacterium]
MDSGKIIDGKDISSKIKDEVREETKKLLFERNIIPGLAFIIVGENVASKVYVKSKGKACEEIGFHSVTKSLPETTTETDLLRIIHEFNNDKSIHGVLVQLPLPKHINEQKIIEAIDYKKDVDGFHPQNVGRLSIGQKCFIPCTPYGIVEMIKRSKVDTNGKNVVVIGRSNIVGKPMASLFLRKDLNSTVTICHSATKDIKAFTLQADILIAAIGKPEFVKGDMIKEDSVIIDVGINRVDDNTVPKGYRLTGDVDYNSCFGKVSKITPVPGGVGPMTIAMLMRNTLDSASQIIYE